MRRRKIRGVSMLAVIALLLGLGISYAGWNSYQRSQARAAHQAAVSTSIASMDKAQSQWMDAMKVASASPRIALATPMAGLQSLRQSVQALPVPECLAANKQHLIKGMDEGLEGMFAFMRNELPKYELEDLTTKKMQLMMASFAEYDKKPTPCLQKT